MRIYCHYESIKHQALEILQSIKRSKIQAGIALNPQTSVDSVKHLLPDCDAVLIMSVQPGYSGQKFIPETVEKVRALRVLSEKVVITIDGGVNETNGRDLVKAGADILSMNNYLYKGDPVQQKDELLKLIYPK